MKFSNENNEFLESVAVADIYQVGNPNETGTLTYSDLLKDQELEMKNFNTTNVWMQQGNSGWLNVASNTVQMNFDFNFIPRCLNLSNSENNFPLFDAIS
jgi:hypothetical protein